MKLRNILACLSLAFLPLGAASQENVAVNTAGTLVYSLPQTSLTFEVTTVQENFHAGPYAQFAEKYLGVKVRQKDEVSIDISKINVTSYSEADPSSRRFIPLGAVNLETAFLQLTSCGLIAQADAYASSESRWRFPVNGGEQVTDGGLTSNLSSVSTTLYKTVKNEGGYIKVPVQHSVKVAKTLEKKAAETASLIFGLREKRMQIITGDTDATYSGEAMGAAVAEIGRLEAEYLRLFTGYSESNMQTVTFDYVPDRAKLRDILFRISDAEGVLPATDLSGKPVVIEFAFKEAPALEEMDEKEARKLAKNSVFVTYREPAVATFKLMDGTRTLLVKRLPIYQFGSDCTFPLAAKIK